MHRLPRVIPLLVAFVAIALWPASAALAGTRTINFDDVTAPTLFANTEPLTDRYAALGVIFSGRRKAPAAPSSTPPAS